MSKIKYVCTKCGSDNVLFDSWARWNEDKQEMELETTFNNSYCEDCENDCRVKEVEIEETSSVK